MIDDDEIRAAKFLRRWVVGLVVMLLLVGGAAAAAGRAFDLFWFPWEIRQQTGMIRASNGYLDAQVSALRTLRADYEDAGTEGQRAAIVAEMRGIADKIPGGVPPDIGRFLAGGR